MYDFKEIKDALISMGVAKGDLLYVASDITLLLRNAFKKGIKSVDEQSVYINSFINVLQQVVGDGGTLLFPMFSWEFCRGKDFYISTSLGEVGSLNNWILQHRSDFIRTCHPLYSFLVWGKDAQLLSSLDNTDAWGQDSPFAYLHHHAGKMLLFNVSLQRGFTFMHYVEESVKVPYRYMKSFKGNYVDNMGIRSERIYTMYVRDLAIQSEEYLPENFLMDNHAMLEKEAGGQTLRIIDLPLAYSIVADDLKENNGHYCYKFYDYSINWNKGATHDDDFSNGLP